MRKEKKSTIVKRTSCESFKTSAEKKTKQHVIEWWNHQGLKRKFNCIIKSNVNSDRVNMYVVCFYFVHVPPLSGEFEIDVGLEATDLWFGLHGSPGSLIGSGQGTDSCTPAAFSNSWYGASGYSSV